MTTALIEPTRRIRPSVPPLGYGKIHVDVGIPNLTHIVLVVCQNHQGNYLGSSSLVISGILDVATLKRNCMS